MTAYHDMMAAGAGEYADVLMTLRDSGLSVEFTQTGGMCAALQVTLEAGHLLLITDAEDSLSWSRDRQVGWAVGLYQHDDTDQPLTFAATTRNDTTALLTLIETVMHAAGNRCLTVT